MSIDVEYYVKQLLYATRERDIIPRTGEQIRLKRLLPCGERSVDRG